jgi:NhaP-type Na+/H+ or K+/H+ antiporter
VAQTSTSVNIIEPARDGSVPWEIIIACLIIAALGLLIGILWLRARKARHARGHLHAEIGRRETLADVERHRERRP